MAGGLAHQAASNVRTAGQWLDNREPRAGGGRDTLLRASPAERRSSHWPRRRAWWPADSTRGLKDADSEESARPATTAGPKRHGPVAGSPCWRRTRPAPHRRYPGAPAMRLGQRAAASRRHVRSGSQARRTASRAPWSRVSRPSMRTSREQPARPDPAAPDSRPSVGELFSDVAEDLSTLMRQEVELAKAELRQSASRGAKGAGLLGGAGHQRPHGPALRIDRRVVGHRRRYRSRMVGTDRGRHLASRRGGAGTDRPPGDQRGIRHSADHGDHEEDP